MIKAMCLDGFDDDKTQGSIVDVPVTILAGRYMRSAAVARRLGIAPSSVRWLSNVGRLGYIPSPFGYLYLEEHLQRYLRKRAQLWNHRRGRRGEPRKPSP